MREQTEQTGPIDQSLDYDAQINFSMQQNGVPIVKQLQLKNTADRLIEDLTVVTSIEPDICPATTVLIAAIAAGTTYNVNELAVTVPPERLVALSERERATLDVRVFDGQDCLSSAQYPLELLSYNEWPGTSILPEILASFILPNHPDVSTLLGRARDILEEQTGSPSLDGYQSNSADRVLSICRAVYQALQQADITYVNPPASFEREGQKVRTPEQILKDRMGTCLDVSLLYAACLEQAGLHPLLVLVEGHALVACWLTEEHFPIPTMSDVPQRLRKRVKLGTMTIVEATAITARPSPDFALAREQGFAHLEAPGATFTAIDVKAARIAGIRPVPPRKSMDEFVYAAESDVPVIEQQPTSLPPTTERAPEQPSRFETRIDRWKSSLLDLSLRNRLLNFRETKSTMELCCHDLAMLEDGLASGSSFSLAPIPSFDESTEPEDTQLNRAVADAFGAGRLLCRSSDKKSYQSLTHIYRQARSSLEESGANTLYLALGMLHWYETTTAQKERRAPILLLAVELKRLSMREGFTISLAEEEPLFNLTLQKKLESDFGIQISGLDPLPVDEQGLDVTAILQAVRKAVLAEDRWEVRESAFIGHFSFTKYLMWRDLEHRSSDLLENEVVHHLVETPSAAFTQNASIPTIADLDASYQPADILCPLDADSSQLSAIMAAAADVTYVLEGPPGTGKSQTITNLVAHCLANGKRVLFVSEKKAALDVVYRRLASVGLEPFCLELHSNKVRKQHVLDQLRHSLESTSPAEPSTWKESAESLARLRAQLNQYVTAIHRPRSFGESVYRVTARVIGLTNAPACALELDGIGDVDSEERDTLCTIVDTLTAAATLVSPPMEHPWYGSQRDRWEPSLAREVDFALVSIQETRSRLERYAEDVFQRLGLPFERPDFNQLRKVYELLELLIRPPAHAGTFLAAESYRASINTIRDWAKQADQRSILRESLIRRYQLTALLALPLSELSGTYRSWLHSNTIVRWFALWGTRSTLAAARCADEGSYQETLEELERAIELHELERQFDQTAARGEELLGADWQDGEPDSAMLSALADWVEGYHQTLEALPNVELERLQSYVTNGCSTDARTAFEQYISEFDSHDEARLALAEALDFDLSIAWPADDSPRYLAQIEEKVRTWQGAVATLRDWCPFIAACKQAETVGLHALVNSLVKGTMVPEQLRPAFERAFYERWLETVVGADDVLRSFRGRQHEQTIAEFQQLDRTVRDLTSAVIRARLASRVPSTGGDAPETSELGILQRELKKQRRHRSVRWLLQRIPSLLSRLCPCLLMSPLSVAQYLDPAYPPFDLVVFDEASQIPVWDAVGAIARGNHLVVVGDSRQLPPTMFFHKGEGDEVPSEDDIEELESILDECAAGGLPRLYLQWHYRSRHENLITFSNHHYYDGRLFTFPSPGEHGTELGVEWRHIEDGLYDRGNSQTNRKEAEALVAEVIRRLSSPTERHRSIGVVTFSTAQQTLIEDLLDEARRERPELEEFFSSDCEEPLFVKNLENVQGDERSVMLFSICYGPDDNGRVAMNFGPLNRQGGERRLNVAITRAREKLIVFSTLLPDQIDLSRSAAVGVHHLKTFLEYAARGPAAIGEVSVTSAEKRPDELKEELASLFTEAGYHVSYNVGCSGYRIALAISHPDEPSEYILGIECDGPLYGTAPTARDRDRLRREVLERLGWRLTRVWSADYWLDAARERERLLELAATSAAELAAEREARESALDEPTETLPETTAETPPETPAETPPETPPETPAKTPTERSTEEHAAAATNGVSEYRQWDPGRKRGKSADFFERKTVPLLVEALGEIVDCEAPISLSLATRRLASAWQVSRVTKKVRQWVKDVIAAFSAAERPKLVDGFLWHHSQEPTTYQGYRTAPDGSETPRDGDDIPPIEYANAAEQVVKLSIAIPRDDLIKEVARLFGFARAGSKLKRSIDDGIDLLAARGGCVFEDDRVKLP